MLERSLETRLQKWLGKGKTIVLTGARQVGKTTILKKVFANAENGLWLNADEPQTRDSLEINNLEDLKLIVGNKKLLVIDEIQRVKNAGLLLKLLTDNFKDLQVVATGSSALEISDSIFEPLTGRHFLFHLYPLTTKELYASSSPFEIQQQLSFHLVYGYYPEISIQRAIAEELLKNIAGQYLYKDVLIWKDLRKPQLLDQLLKLLAYQIGSEVSIHELAKTLRVKSETIESYIDLLEKSFVIFRLKALSNNPRKEISKMSKIYFWDCGIRNAVIGDFRELKIRTDQGALFENLVVADRMKYKVHHGISNSSYFWRNMNGSEVDYIEVEHETINAYEIKYNMLKNHKVTRAFTNSYPTANPFVITPKNAGLFQLSYKFME